MRVLLCCFFVLFRTFSASTQSYIPLVSEDKTWDIFSWHSQEFAYWTGGSRLSFAGDTVINGQQYKIARGNGYAAYEDPVFDEPFVRSNIAYTAGFMREDLSARKVYALDNDGAEHLIYDFSLQTGDTLRASYAAEDLSFRLDTIIDIVLPNGELSREFVFYPATGYWFPETEPVIITEGIGSRISLFFPFLYGSFEGGSAVSCVQKNNVTLYSDAGVFGCDFVLVGTEDILADEEINIFPHPATSSFHIQTQSQMKALQLWSRDGQRLGSWPVGSNTGQVDVSSLPAGVYLLKVFYEDSSFQWKKLVIVD